MKARRETERGARRRRPEAVAPSLRLGFSLVELIVVMSILIVVMSLAIGAGSAVIEANRRSLQQASFEILDQVLEDFARQNPLKVYLDEDGAGQVSWKGFYSKYPPMDLTGVTPGFNSGTVSEDINIAGRNLHQRIMGQFTPPIPGVLPGARVREGIRDGSFGVAATATAFAHDGTESFLFYVRYYSPANAARLEKLAEGMVTNGDEDWVDLDDNGEPEEGDIALNELRDVWGNPVLYINDCRDRFDNASTSSAGADGRIDNPLLEANNGKPVFVSPGPDGYFTNQDMVGPGAEGPPTDPLADNIYSIPRAVVERLDPADLNDLLRYDFTTNRWKPR